MITSLHVLAGAATKVDLLLERLSHIDDQLSSLQSRILEPRGREAALDGNINMASAVIHRPAPAAAAAAAAGGNAVPVPVRAKLPRFRPDGRCGPNFPAPGAPAFGECKPTGNADQVGPCCNPVSGWCGNERGVDWGASNCRRLVPGPSADRASPPPLPCSHWHAYRGAGYMVPPLTPPVQVTATVRHVLITPWPEARLRATQPLLPLQWRQSP